MLDDMNATLILGSEYIIQDEEQDEPEVNIFADLPAEEKEDRRPRLFARQR